MEPSPGVRRALAAAVVAWWAATTALSLWWAVEMCSLAARRSLANPALSGDGADYEGAATAAAWTVLSAASLLSCAVPFGSAQRAVRLALFCQTVAYAWNLATLTTFAHTYRRHHAALVSAALPTATVAGTLVMCAVYS